MRSLISMALLSAATLLMQVALTRFFSIAQFYHFAFLVVSLALRRDEAPPIEAEPGALVPNAFLQITKDNQVRFYCPRDEMGQGVTTGLSTLIGEELDVNPAHIDIHFAGVHDDYANPIFRVQATGGSTSMRGHFRPLRQAGADVRALIIEAAALDLGVPSESLSTSDAHIVAGERHLPYGQFVTTAAGLELPTGTSLKPSRTWRYIGKEWPRVDGLAKSTGTAQFGIDIEVPNLHRAVVVHPPVAGSGLRSFQADSALAIPGVTDVVAISSGIAVVAESFWSAKKGAEAIRAEWELPPLAAVHTQQVKADYRSALAEAGDEDTSEAAELSAALDAAHTRIDATYWTPYLAHAPMEPMNATVRIDGDQVEVWSGTQGAA